jgi:drug/metabolite transporter (DMT)-like permease
LNPGADAVGVLLLIVPAGTVAAGIVWALLAFLHGAGRPVAPALLRATRTITAVGLVACGAAVAWSVPHFWSTKPTSAVVLATLAALFAVCGSTLAFGRRDPRWWRVLRVVLAFYGVVVAALLVNKAWR